MFLRIFLTLCDAQIQPNKCNSYANLELGMWSYLWVYRSWFETGCYNVGPEVHAISLIKHSCFILSTFGNGYFLCICCVLDVWSGSICRSQFLQILDTIMILSVKCSSLGYGSIWCLSSKMKCSSILFTLIQFKTSKEVPIHPTEKQVNEIYFNLIFWEWIAIHWPPKKTIQNSSPLGA